MERRPRFDCTKFWVSLVAFAWLGVLAPAAEPKYAPGSDWPSYRHDATLSGISPLKGGLARSPRVVWSVDLGGPRLPSETIRIRDVTGDGRDEILILGLASIECRDARGARLWVLEGVPSPSVLDIRDYAGDGSRGILLSTARRPSDRLHGGRSLGRSRFALGGPEQLRRAHAVRQAARGRRRSAGGQYLQWANTTRALRRRHSVGQLRERPRPATFPNSSPRARRFLLAPHALRRPRRRRRRGDGRD